MSAAMLGLGLLIFAASLFTALFRRTGVPDVLLLIGVGLLLGQATGQVSPGDFGKLGGLMSTLALVLILFEGGLSLSLDVLASALGQTLGLTLLGFASTAVIVWGFGTYALGLGPTLAMALGAIAGGTSSAVVIPMVKELGMGRVPETTLVLESAITDVLCIIVAGGVLASAGSDFVAPTRIAGGVVASLVAAAGLGFAAALAFYAAVNVVVKAMPNPMLTLLAYVFVVYGLTEALGFSGAVAALTLGFTLTNMRRLGIHRLRPFSHVAEVKIPTYVGLFLADATFLLKTFFFVYLGISIRFADTALVLWALAAVLTVYGVRAAVVRLAVPRATARRDAGIMAVMAPKGLAAAVLAGTPVQMGLAGAEIAQQFTYMVVLISISLTSLLVPLLRVWPVRHAFDVLFRGFAEGPEPRAAASDVHLRATGA